MAKLSPELMFRSVARTLHGSSMAAVLALFTWVTLGASKAAEAATMEVDAIGTIDYYHYTTLERSVVTPTVSYFDTLGSEVPNPFFDFPAPGTEFFITRTAISLSSISPLPDLPSLSPSKTTWVLKPRISLTIPGIRLT